MTATSFIVRMYCQDDFGVTHYLGNYNGEMVESPSKNEHEEFKNNSLKRLYETVATHKISFTHIEETKIYATRDMFRNKLNMYLWVGKTPKISILDEKAIRSLHSAKIPSKLENIFAITRKYELSLETA